MRVTKLVVGILMIVLSVWLFLQALLGGFLGIISTSNILLGVLEMVMCGLFMGAGIVYIATESREGLGGDITGFVLMIIAGLLGMIGWTYNWMILYGIIALIIGIGFFVWHLND